MQRRPPNTPHQLLDDLESIRDLLDEQAMEPPLLTDSLDDDLDDEQLEIPLLDEVVPPTRPSVSAPAAPVKPSTPSVSTTPTNTTPAAPITPSKPAAALSNEPGITATRSSASHPLTQRPNSIKEALAESLRQGHIQPPAGFNDEPAASLSASQLKLENELRAAAQLILQEVIDDFVPKIEAELKTRLEARLHRLLPPNKR